LLPSRLAADRWARASAIVVQTESLMQALFLKR
jgi:hypothetical protein